MSWQNIYSLILLIIKSLTFANLDIVISKTPTFTSRRT
nr:MAG TPA: hypothetical protein [Caudoviricetes sp.]